MTTSEDLAAGLKICTAWDQADESWMIKSSCSDRIKMALDAIGVELTGDEMAALDDEIYEREQEGASIASLAKYIVFAVNFFKDNI